MSRSPPNPRYVAHGEAWSFIWCQGDHFIPPPPTTHCVRPTFHQCKGRLTNAGPLSPNQPLIYTPLTTSSLLGTVIWEANRGADASWNERWVLCLNALWLPPPHAFEVVSGSGPLVRCLFLHLLVVLWTHDLYYLSLCTSPPCHFISLLSLFCFPSPLGSSYGNLWHLRLQFIFIGCGRHPYTFHSAIPHPRICRWLGSPLLRNLHLQSVPIPPYGSSIIFRDEKDGTHLVWCISKSFMGSSTVFTNVKEVGSISGLP